MLSKARNLANKKVNVGSQEFSYWQIASTTTAVLYLGYRAYKRFTRPKYGYHTTGKT